MTTHKGKYGLGIRNERGDMLANFEKNEGLYIMNIFYQEKPDRKWTYVSPNGEIKSEIDIYLTNKQHILQDVEVLNQFSTESDNGIVRGKITNSCKQEMKKKFCNEVRNIREHQIITNRDKYEEQLNEILSEKPR